MLLSMTGYGDARVERAGLACGVEVRSVNNRFFKLSVRTAERFAALEPEIEKVVRDSVRRGTVYVNVRIHGDLTASSGRIHRRTLEDYIADLQSAGLYDRSLLGSILGLPGVVEESDDRIEIDAIVPLVRQSLQGALEKLQRMRIDEGAAMQRELADSALAMNRIAMAIEERGPEVVKAYRNRMQDRVQGLLNDLGAKITEMDLIREITIFAERCDVGEELVRLKSHLAQLSETLDAAESNGRKLDFLVQEMYREANTIGAKANDAAVAQWVIELKGRIERARELIQNVE